MTKEKMLEVIYDKIADKTLNEGCNFYYFDTSGTNGEKDYPPSGIYEIIYIGDEQILLCGDEEVYSIDNIEDNGTVYTIIGHKIFIGDVLDWFDNKTEWSEEVSDGNNGLIDRFNYEAEEQYFKIIDIWKLKRKPIEEQTIECIEYIYNLIKKKGLIYKN